MSLKHFILSLFLYLLSLQTYSQSTIDSTWFAQNCGGQLYFTPNYLGKNWFIMDKFIFKDSIINNVNNIFKYADSQFIGSYSKINIYKMINDDSINSTFDFLNTTNNYYKLKNKSAIKEIIYNLYGIFDTARVFYRYSDAVKNFTNKRIAFLCIPSSGSNQSYIQEWGWGISTNNCYVNDLLETYGDVYTLVKPNEDFEAIHNGLNKISNEFLMPYLDTINKNYGTNYLIRANAVVKYLKSQYDYIAVVGLSEGGYGSLLVSLESEPDFSIVSSGYSIMFNDPNFGIHYPFLQLFGSSYLHYNKDVIKQTMCNMNTNFLFTYGINDGMAVFYQEYLTDSTVKFFNNCPNFYYNKNSMGHAFPNCSILDSFILNNLIEIPLHDGHAYKKDSLFFNINDNYIYFTSALEKKCKYTFEIYDINGNRLFNSIFREDFRINISQFSSGVYIIRLYEGASIRTYKFFKL